LRKGHLPVVMKRVMKTSLQSGRRGHQTNERNFTRKFRIEREEDLPIVMKTITQSQTTCHMSLGNSLNAGTGMEPGRQRNNRLLGLLIK